MGKIRAIIKRPDEEYGHMTNISGKKWNKSELERWDDEDE